MYTFWLTSIFSPGHSLICVDIWR